jgi:hypothetical protein
LSYRKEEYSEIDEIWDSQLLTKAGSRRLEFEI